MVQNIEEVRGGEEGENGIDDYHFMGGHQRSRCKDVGDEQASIAAWLTRTSYGELDGTRQEHCTRTLRKHLFICPPKTLSMLANY